MPKIALCEEDSIFGEALVEEHVHILVQVPTGMLHKRLLDLS